MRSTLSTPTSWGDEEAAAEEARLLLLLEEEEEEDGRDGRGGQIVVPSVATSEEYFVICEAIRVMWAALSPPSQLGASGKVTPMRFLRLMWCLDSATVGDGAAGGSNDDRAATPSSISSSSSSAAAAVSPAALFSPSVRVSWKEFLDSIIQEFGEDNNLAASITHEQFESFFWAFSESVQPTSARARVFQQWANAVTKPKNEEIDDILSLMDGDRWTMSPRIEALLGIQGDQERSDRDTSLFVIEHLLKCHSDAPWHWWHRIRPTLIRLVPALGKSDGGNSNAFPSLSRALQEISASALESSSMHNTIIDVDFSSSPSSQPVVSLETRTVLERLGLKKPEPADTTESAATPETTPPVAAVAARETDATGKNKNEDNGEIEATQNGLLMPRRPKTADTRKQARRQYYSSRRPATSSRKRTQHQTRNQRTNNYVVSQSMLRLVRRLPESAPASRPSSSMRINTNTRIEQQQAAKQQRTRPTTAPSSPVRCGYMNTYIQSNKKKKMKKKKRRKWRNRQLPESNRPGSSNARMLMTITSASPLRSATVGTLLLQPGTRDIAQEQSTESYCHRFDHPGAVRTLSQSRVSRMKLRKSNRTRTEVKLKPVVPSVSTITPTPTSATTAAAAAAAETTTTTTTTSNGNILGGKLPLVFRRLKGRYEPAGSLAQKVAVEGSADNLIAKSETNVATRKKIDASPLMIANSPTRALTSEIASTRALTSESPPDEKEKAAVKCKRQRPIGVGHLAEQNVPLIYSLNVLRSGFLRATPVLQVGQHRISPRPPSSAFQRRLDQYFYGSQGSDDMDAPSENNGNDGSERTGRSEMAAGWHTTSNKELQVRVPGSGPELSPQKTSSSATRKFQETHAVNVLNSESGTWGDGVESESKAAAFAGLELARSINAQVERLEAMLVAS
jgi:hypothetical protein